MGCGIYEIKNIVNGKRYIGSSVDIKTRITRHKSMLRGGYHDNAFLQNAFIKYGEEVFIFQTIEECSEHQLVEKENFHINENKTNNQKYGYNLALVTITRRNEFSSETKIKMSKTKLQNNKNFLSFTLIEINTDKEYNFDNLYEAADYLIKNNYAKSKNEKVRGVLSNALRGVVVNNGSKGSIRKTIYKHKFKILN